MNGVEVYRIWQAREFVRPVIQHSLEDLAHKFKDVLTPQQRQTLAGLINSLAEPFPQEEPTE